MFSKPADFEAFIKLMGEAFEKFKVDLLAFCLMGNHWHMLLRPREDAALSRCMAWMTVTHARRHHKHYPNPGTGHLYQGRFKSFPVQSDKHFLIVARYIHQNPLRAGLAKRVQQWRWNDLSGVLAVKSWPIDPPSDWAAIVNDLISEPVQEQIEQSVRRGTPFGSPSWIRRTADRLNLGSSLRQRGRPQKPIKELSSRQRRRRMREQLINDSGHKSRRT